MVLPVLRFNFASPQGDPRTQGELIRAALELAQWGESRGVLTVSVDEHHATGHGWSCNPILAAGMLLARTSTLIASVDCALGPLWNPVRLAEDIALVDNMSRGRLHTTVGLGYRTVEYDTLGVDFDQARPADGRPDRADAVGVVRHGLLYPAAPTAVHRRRRPRHRAAGRHGFGCRSASPIICPTSRPITANWLRTPEWRRWSSCRARSTAE